MVTRRLGLILTLLIALCGLPAWALGQDSSPVSGVQIVFSVDLKPTDIKTDDVRAAAQVLARRLEGLDIHPYLVQVLAEKAIQVQLPGSVDVQSVTEALTQAALLELVDMSGLSDRVTDFAASTLITSAWKADPNLPPRDDGQMNPLTNKPFDTVLTGADFSSVVTIHNSNDGQWEIGFGLRDAAAQKIGEFTGSHIGEALAITLDGKVLSTPVIQAQFDDVGIISGNFTEDEAKRLAAEIHAGTLPLPLKATSIVTIEAVTLPS